MCTCETFTTQAGDLNPQCLHTKHVYDHCPAVDVATPGHGVIPIRSLIPDIKPYAYWVKQRFVIPARVTQQLHCTHPFHQTQCEHCEAVKQFLSSAGHDEMDPDDDMLQVRLSPWLCCAMLLCPVVYC